jgi:hypothetical protein
VENISLAQQLNHLSERIVAHIEDIEHFIESHRSVIQREESLIYWGQQMDDLYSLCVLAKEAKSFLSESALEESPNFKLLRHPENGLELMEAAANSLSHLLKMMEGLSVDSSSFSRI